MPSCNQAAHLSCSHETGARGGFSTTPQSSGWENRETWMQAGVQAPQRRCTMETHTTRRRGYTQRVPRATTGYPGQIRRGAGAASGVCREEGLVQAWRGSGGRRRRRWGGASGRALAPHVSPGGIQGHVVSSAPQRGSQTYLRSALWRRLTGLGPVLVGNGAWRGDGTTHGRIGVSQCREVHPPPPVHAMAWKNDRTTSRTH